MRQDLACLIILAAALAGCAKTRIEVIYDDGGGKKITANYTSTKDLETPTFNLVRDSVGNVQSIQLGAGSSLASPVNAQTNELVGRIVQGAVEGAIEGMRRVAPVPGAAHQPVTIQDVERRIWAAHRPEA